MAKLGRRLFAGFAFIAGMAGYYGWRLIGQVDAAQISAGGPRTSMRAWDIDFVSIEGDALPLKNFQGKALLVVNTASLCGFTPQYKELEKIWTDYKDKGLVVIGVPSNDFGGQEPGSAAEIKAFCESYDVSFPIAEKGGDQRCCPAPSNSSVGWRRNWAMAPCRAGISSNISSGATARCRGLGPRPLRRPAIGNPRRDRKGARRACLISS